MSSEPEKAYQLVGFDYVEAILDLRKRFTYAQLIQKLGYESPAAINKILAGAVPSHERGEALYVLYRETFGRKPPLNIHQRKQLTG